MPNDGYLKTTDQFTCDKSMVEPLGYARESSDLFVDAESEERESASKAVGEALLSEGGLRIHEH